jgi:hypothetical protein
MAEKSHPPTTTGQAFGSPPGPRSNWTPALVGHVLDASGALVTGTAEHLVHALT